jgi:hypothetical protein
MSERNQRRYIAQELVDNYVNCNTQYKKWKEKRDALRLELIDADAEGLECSPRSPFLISITPTPKKHINWKMEFERLAKRVLPRTWRKEQNKVIENTQEVEEMVVTVAPNPALARKR